MSLPPAVVVNLGFGSAHRDRDQDRGHHHYADDDTPIDQSSRLAQRGIVAHRDPIEVSAAWNALNRVPIASAPARRGPRVLLTLSTFVDVTIPSVDGTPSVGLAGFEPTTTRPPAGCATKLRYSPLITY